LDEFMNHFFYIQVLQLLGATSTSPCQAREGGRVVRNLAEGKWDEL